MFPFYRTHFYRMNHLVKMKERRKKKEETEERRKKKKERKKKEETEEKRKKEETEEKRKKKPTPLGWTKIVTALRVQQAKTHGNIWFEKMNYLIVSIQVK